MKIDSAKHWSSSVSEFRDALIELVRQYPAPDVLELGGGRFPHFELDEMPPTLHSYTVNDISADELSRARPGYATACFDVSGDVSEFAGRYDVVFSHYMGEHIKDGVAFHRNAFELLKPGGVSFHLIPTLFASPFIINKLIPEKLSHAVLTTLFPIRKHQAPKHPAFYSQCRGNTKGMRKMLTNVGFSRVEIRDFYGHFYYDRIPVLRELENLVSGIASKNDWSWYSSFAFITAYK